MTKQNPIQVLLDTPMTRKQFLQHVGMIFLSVIGLTKLLETVFQGGQPQLQHATGRRWGGGKFGV